MDHDHGDLKSSKERRENAKLVPDAYIFPAKTALRVSDAVRKHADADKLELVVHLGLKENGKPEAFAEVKADGDSVYYGNETGTCPPNNC